MRRTLALALICLGIFAGAAAVGFLVSARVAPEQIRESLQARLSELLGTPARIEETQLYLHWGLAVEARGVSAWPGPDGPALAIPRAIMKVDLLPLLAGQVRGRWLRFESPRLRIQRERGGRIVAPFRWSPGEEPPAPRATAYERARSAVDAVLGGLLRVPLSANRLEIVDGEITLSEVADAPLQPTRELRIGALSGRLSRDRSHRAGRIEIRARIVPGEGSPGELHAVARVAASGRMRVQLEAAKVDLAPLSPYAAGLDGRLAVRGVATGQVEMRMEPEEPHRIDADLRLGNLALSLPTTGNGSVPIEAKDASIRTSLRLTNRRLEVGSGQLESRGIALGLEGAVELPMRKDARVRLAFHTPSLPLEKLEGPASWLAGEAAQRALERVQSGRITDLELRVTTALSHLAANPLSGPWPLWRDLEVRGALEDVSLEVADSERLEAARARFVLDQDRLDLLVSAASWSGAALPRLDLSVAGLSYLFPIGELQCSEPAPVPGLPGRVALDRWMKARRRPDAPPSWSHLMIEADRIAHPALLCTAEHVRASIGPRQEEWGFEVHQATWAGAPVEGWGSYRTEPEAALSLSVKLGPPWEPVSPPASGAPWATGRFEMAANRFGPWRIRGVRGGFELVGSSLRLGDAELALVPEGTLRGALTLDLSQEEAVPYETHFSIENGSAAHLVEALDRDRTLARGTVTAAGVIQGILRGAQSPFAEASGTAVVMARQGELHRRIPPILAIAMASDVLGPDRSAVPFDAIDAVLELDQGMLRTQSLTLDGPWIRALASGEVDVAHPPYTTESVVAMFLFRNLDNVISKVPVLSRVLLGDDENLINAYFALSGPVGQPEARLIPVKTLSAGPASFVLEGFPAFVRGGLNRLLSVLSPGGRDPEDPQREPVRVDS